MAPRTEERMPFRTKHQTFTWYVLSVGDGNDDGDDDDVIAFAHSWKLARGHKKKKKNGRNVDAISSPEKKKQLNNSY